MPDTASLALRTALLCGVQVLTVITISLPMEFSHCPPNTECEDCGPRGCHICPGGMLTIYTSNAEQMSCIFDPPLSPALEAEVQGMRNELAKFRDLVTSERCFTCGSEECTACACCKRVVQPVVKQTEFVGRP